MRRPPVELNRHHWQPIRIAPDSCRRLSFRTASPLQGSPTRTCLCHDRNGFRRDIRLSTGMAGARSIGFAIAPRRRDKSCLVEFHHPKLIRSRGTGHRTSNSSHFGTCCPGRTRACTRLPGLDCRSFLLGSRDWWLCIVFGAHRLSSAAGSRVEFSGSPLGFRRQYSATTC